MAKIDPERERRRLADFYAGQLDGELEKVAGQAYELTDLAKEALRAELLKRGLTPAFTEERPAPPIPAKAPPQPGDPPPVEPWVEEDQLADGDQSSDEEDDEPDFRHMMLLRRFRDLPEALIAKGSLDSAGIKCALFNENLVRLDWFWSNLMGGVQLRVDAEEVEAANEILSQPITEHLDVSGVGDFEQPACPRCGSLDVNFRESDPVAYVAMAIIAPIPIRRRAWRCHSCNAEWREEESSSSESTR